jgi:LuxR family maltose regulon positive regulatory protein
MQQAVTSGHKRARQSRPQPLIEPLTNRELDVLELLARRLYDKEIADELSVSVPTVKTHISHILHKLGVGNRRAAADKARELGIIE